MNTKEKYDKNEPHEETPNKAFNNYGTLDRYKGRTLRIKKKSTVNSL